MFGPTPLRVGFEQHLSGLNRLLACVQGDRFGLLGFTVLSDGRDEEITDDVAL